MHDTDKRRKHASSPTSPEIKQVVFILGFEEQLIGYGIPAYGQIKPVGQSDCTPLGHILPGGQVNWKNNKYSQINAKV